MAYTCQKSFWGQCSLPLVFIIYILNLSLFFLLIYTQKMKMYPTSLVIRRQMTRLWILFHCLLAGWSNVFETLLSPLKMNMRLFYWSCPWLLSIQRMSGLQLVRWSSLISAWENCSLRQLLPNSSFSLPIPSRTIFTNSTNNSWSPSTNHVILYWVSSTDLLTATRYCVPINSLFLFSAILNLWIL